MLIALAGKLRAGKDEVADYLVSEYGFVKYGMSDPLNEALLTLNPWVKPDYSVRVGFTFVKPWEYIRYQELHNAVGYVEAKKHSDVRTYLQRLGTEVGREMINPTVWIDIAEKRIRESLEKNVPVAITAIRFENELDMVDRLGGHTIWIERDAELRGEDSTYAQHASENGIQKYQCNWTIRNNGTIEELRAVIDSLITALRTTGELPE